MKYSFYFPKTNKIVKIEAEGEEEALELLRMKYCHLEKYSDKALLERLFLDKDENECSEEYPLGGMIEPYDIDKEERLINGY